MGVTTRARSGVRADDDADADEDEEDAGGRSCEEIGQISPDSAKFRKSGRLLAYKGNCRLEPLRRLELLVRIMGVARHFHLGVWGCSITRVHGNSRNPKSRRRYSQSRNWP